MNNNQQLKLKIASLALFSLGLTPQFLSADIVHPDDTIIIGSSCIGLDCADGEIFGSTSLILKENNTRILFEDTSTAGGFPTNDWQIIANSTFSGGAEKFSIDDITAGETPFTIEAGAPSNSIFVNSGGRLGLGTSTPNVDLHVVSGDSPTLRLDQDDSSGFGAQVWDVVGNETNFFIRDTTGGSLLPFKIIPNSPSNSLVINGGNVGLNTSSPTANLHVKNDDTNMLLLENDHATKQYRTLFKATNHGPVGFEIEDREKTIKWQFRTNNGGDFLINEQGIAGSEFKVSPSGNALFSGKVTATGFKVGAINLNVPDYVFKRDYKLMPLDQLKAFVAKEKHLPNVLSESDIKKAKTLDLGESQMTHLEKIEELTLYTLQQHEQLKVLRDKVAENTKMKERLSFLEKLVSKLTPSETRKK